MAWTQAEIDTLKAAIAKGVKTVAYSDKTITYQNLEEMLQALNVMEGNVEAEASAATGSRSTFASFRRD